MYHRSTTSIGSSSPVSRLCTVRLRSARSSPRRSAARRAARSNSWRMITLVTICSAAALAAYRMWSGAGSNSSVPSITAALRARCRRRNASCIASAARTCWRVPMMNASSRPEISGADA
eukprot:266522-Pleurochrysis_carterae.AAC.2